LVVQLGLDSQRLLVEPPDLGVSSIWSLDDYVSVVDEIKISAGSESSLDVEWSFNVESEAFIEFALSWLFWIFVNINDVELLVDLAMFVPGNDVLAFSIHSSFNIKYLSLFVDDESTFTSPHLPPS